MVDVPNHIIKIMARFMEERADEGEISQLTAWIEASDENMQFFKTIMEERNTNWAKKWFKRAGVRNNYFKGKSFNGWYEPDKKNPRHYYMLAGLGILMLIIIWLVLEFRKV